MRKLSHAVVACLAGAGLILYAVTRVWSDRVTDRPGLSALHTRTTGAEAEPWLAGLALVALAAAGALLATRGRVRQGLGGVLVAAGLGCAAGALTARSGPTPGEASPIWPWVVVLGAAILVLSGVATARHGRSWPTMGSRYDRSQAPPLEDSAATRSGPSAPAGPGRPHDHADTRATWDALDRGTDPTA